ncbi:MAG TPA: phosphatidylserine decarboxylase family protein [Candidatus Acidoferrales bacterium]|nr:phosphatidylserine decarboxylase family protein [Candidatus Acidoferrales bacterium]
MVKDGYRFALLPLILGIVLLAFRWWWATVFVVLGLFVLYFFRDPERQLPRDPDVVVSPADGRVVEIVDEQIGARAGKRISIFLSIFDVHVNRAPVAGRISRLEYKPGRFMAAWKGKASAENEQNLVALQTPRGEMTFKQIAGWVARRIVFWKRQGDEVLLGERVGMIRFGSRVDVWLPQGAEILVRRGQKVSGGSTVLGRWPSTK